MKEEVRKAVDYLSSNVLMNLKINDEQIKAIEKMVDSILRSKRIFLYGVGRSGLVAKAFSIRLVQLGIDVFFVGDTNTPMIEKNDVVIILSNTGQTMSAVQTANITRRIGAEVIAITSDPNSKIASAASVTVTVAEKVPESEEHELYAPLGTIFEEASALLLDAIVAVLMRRMGETDKSMRKRHAIWV